MSGPLVSASAAFVAKNSRKPPYAIEQSLRFDSGQTGTLTRTPSSNGGSVHTTSAWIKAADSTLMANIFAAYPSESAYGTSTTYDILGWYSEGPYSYIGNGAGNESSLYLGAIDYSYKFRDTSAWYHVIWVSTSTQFEIYVNGVLVASKSRTQNNSYYNQNKPHRISAYRAPNGSVLGYINCYMAEVHFVDGTALDPTDLGEYDEFGVWRPIEYTGTYGNNGFYLKFDPSAANGIGHDHSGNGNNWTASNFTTSGTGTDVMSDTPTTNWCTLNPLVLRYGQGNATFSEGNLKAYFASSSTESYQQATIGASSGKFYWEYELTAWTGDRDAGPLISKPSWPSTSSESTLYWYKTTGAKLIKGTTTNYGASFGVGDVIGVAMDFDGGNLEFFKNGTSQGVAATDLDTFFTVSEPAFPSGRANFGTTYVVNFGQRAFAYTPPSGFLPLNTSNLPAPTVKDGSDYFNTVLWTGNATARDITTGHNSNFTWIKHRSSAENHNLYDILRGVGNRLESNSQDYEVNYTDRLTAFNSDGFSLGTGYNNTNTTTYVGWSWAGGGSGSSNTDGSITSTVSASPSSGFSIVTWTGSQADGTVGHGLGVAPSLIIFKRYNNNGTSWPVYHSAIGPSNFVALNETTASSSSGTLFGSTPTAPTSTVFSVGNNGGTNYGDMIAYCFAEVEGYSKFTSYTGNNNNDGVFCYLGFKPSWLLIKGTNGAYWYIWDEQRSTYNAATKVLLPSDSAAEQDNTTRSIDFLSNGFKLRTNDININANGQQYIVAAFASNPFGGSGVNPATAR